MSPAVFLLIYLFLIFLAVEVSRSALKSLRASRLLNKEFKIISHLCVVAFCVILVLLGADYLGMKFNHIAIKENGGKMPYDISVVPLIFRAQFADDKNDLRHKIYDPSKDSYYFFIDRFWKQKGNSVSIYSIGYSIGDFLIIYSESGERLVAGIFAWLMALSEVLLVIEFVRARRKNN
jgi:hypothetical protein